MADESYPNDQPVAVGGVGGSGTRLFAAALRHVGWYVGEDLNDALDNLWFTLLFKRRELWGAPTAEFASMLRIFRTAMSQAQTLDRPECDLVERLAASDRIQHEAAWLQQRVRSLLVRSPVQRTRWGWKEPNTHLFLDRFASAFPRLRYIHVMRNGLDMAFSANQNQLQLWGSALLGRPVATTPRDSLAYWCAVHRRVQAIGAGMGARFLLLNYDALCAEPEPALRRVLAFLDEPADATLLEGLVALVRPPPSVGRYREHGLQGFDAADVDYVSSLGFDVSP